MAAEGASIPHPQAAWVRSTMTETKIQALVDLGLLRPKAEVEWCEDHVWFEDWWMVTSWCDE
jgi:hypothetical protein